MSWLSLLCWDGFLPLGVTLLPAIVCRFAGRHHFVSLLVAVVIPVSASLVRASIGANHLQHAGPPLVVRQIVFSVGISLLFALELVSSISQLSDPLPNEVWGGIIAGYLVYFGLMAGAFRPISLCGEPDSPVDEL